MIPAAVVGGGIGGLAASVALRNAGIPTQVFERGPAFGELGVAVGITPNGFRALAALGRGIADEVRRRGRTLAPDAVFPIRLANGRTVGANRYGAAAVRHGVPFVNIRRADLHRILLDAHGATGLHAGAELVGLRDVDAPAARFADGREVQADVVVGADGLGSAVRASLHGREPARYVATTLRGIGRVDVTGELAEGSLTLGEGLSLFSLPLADAGTFHWTAVVRAPAGSWPRDAEQSRAAVLERLDGWPFPCRELVAGADAEPLVAGRMYDRPPLTSWSQGGATLLGDAAHPMNNSLGQGANTALEDAVVLAACLASGPDRDEALAAYERERIPRTTRIVLRSAETGGRRGVEVGPGDDEEFTDWLYGYHPPTH